MYFQKQKINDLRFTCNFDFFARLSKLLKLLEIASGTTTNYKTCKVLKTCKTITEFSKTNKYMFYMFFAILTFHQTVKLAEMFGNGVRNNKNYKTCKNRVFQL